MTTWGAALDLLAGSGITVATGLNDREIERVESAIEARLPPDLRTFLAAGLPLGDGFPDWREPGSQAIRRQLDGPFEGMAFDIQNNTFWLSAWGGRPPELADALTIARGHVAAAPRLIPIYGHRYLPAEPAFAGNPVFSVYQTDIIYYGDDLATYLRHEFQRLPYVEAVTERLRRIRFWSDLVDANSAPFTES